MDCFSLAPKSAGPDSKSHCQHSHVSNGNSNQHGPHQEVRVRLYVLANQSWKQLCSLIIKKLVNLNILKSYYDLTIELSRDMAATTLPLTGIP